MNIMSNQLKNNLNAIELTENELDNVVGGGRASLASANALARIQAQASTQMAKMNMMADLNDALNNFTKKIGRSAKDAST
jgi:bacteriocin-like protein